MDRTWHPQLELLWNVVAMIPAGEVWTYGEVAQAAGLAGHARQAGYALKVAPPELKLPWHRVVSAGGRIAFPPGSSAYREQVRRLRAEGLRVAGGRISGFRSTERMMMGEPCEAHRSGD
ncbi:MAG TPA: MGMT family protein [Steroidobacteraceae bacterium]|nr:MGMT family protein [Steroidobacteraceae bacterium]